MVFDAGDAMTVRGSAARKLLAEDDGGFLEAGGNGLQAGEGRADAGLGLRCGEG